MPLPRNLRDSHPHGPPWWPENERWPPSDWSRARGQFLRRIGCLVFLLLLVFVVLPTLMGLVFFGFNPSKHGDNDGPPIGVVIVAVGILVVIGLRILRSLRLTGVVVGDVMDAANSVANGDYAIRVDERGSPEVRQLASAFNTMTERLANSESQRLAMQADIAHELRTPLAVIRGNIEGMLDGVYQATPEQLTAVLSQTERMAKLLEDLQLLSLSDAGVLKLHREPVNLSELVSALLVNDLHALSNHGIIAETIIPKDLELEVDPFRFRQILDNLIQNAINHNPPGVRISIAAEKQHHATLVTVSDNGAGIDQERLSTIFDRYSKSADSQGTGLGLSIAERLVLAHGGLITVESSSSGTAFQIVLPQEV